MAIEREKNDLEIRQTSEQPAILEKDGNAISGLTKHVRGVATVCLGLLGAGEVGCFAHLSPEKKSEVACEEVTDLNHDTYFIYLDLWSAQGYSSTVSTGVTFSGTNYRNDDKEDIQDQIQELRFYESYCNDPVIKLKAFERIGTLYEFLEKYDLALQYYLKAIEIAKNNPTISNSHNIQQYFIRAILRIYDRADACIDVMATKKISNIYDYDSVEKDKLNARFEDIYLDTNEAHRDELINKIMQNASTACKNPLLRAVAYVELGLNSTTWEDRDMYFEEALKLKREIDDQLGPFDNSKIPGGGMVYGYDAWLTAGDLKLYRDLTNSINYWAEYRKERLAKKKVKELRNGPEVRELLENIRMARAAEGREDYDEAFRYYSLAKQSGNQVVYVYKEAGIKIPRDIDVLGIEIGEGRYRNGKRIGINTGQPEPSGGEMDTGTAIWEGLKFLGAVAIQEAPGIYRAAHKTMTFICKNAPEACAPKTSATTYGNGEIEVRTGMTGPLACTDDGIAIKLPYKQETKCTTFSGPSCVIPNLQPGEYEVYAYRAGGCKEQKVGPVKVTVEPNEKIYIDFSRDLE